jgi:c-di-GMP-binding flagellar brake protein YcgR
MPAFNDRRSGDRYAIRTAALLGLPDGRIVDARSLDVGLGGAGVVSDLNLPVGTAVALRLSLPDNAGGRAVFEATAKVVNCTLAGRDGGFRLGLQFDPLSAAASAVLGALLR